MFRASRYFRPDRQGPTQLSSHFGARVAYLVRVVERPPPGAHIDLSERVHLAAKPVVARRLHLAQMFSQGHTAAAGFSGCGGERGARHALLRGPQEPQAPAAEQRWAQALRAGTLFAWPLASGEGRGRSGVPWRFPQRSPQGGILWERAVAQWRASASRGEAICALSKLLQGLGETSAQISAGAHPASDKHDATDSLSTGSPGSHLASDPGWHTLDDSVDRAARDPTTLLVLNIPALCTSEALSQKWPMDGTWDFLYLPMYSGGKRSLGYAFINFATAQHAAAFQARWHGCCLPEFRRGRPLQVMAAEIQGFQARVSRVLGGGGSGGGGSPGCSSGRRRPEAVGTHDRRGGGPGEMRVAGAAVDFRAWVPRSSSTPRRQRVPCGSGGGGGIRVALLRFPR